METNIHPMVYEELMKASTQIACVMAPLANLDLDAKRRILRKYGAAIEGNFIAWMAITAQYAHSIEGRYAASENLAVEVKDNHAGMLHRFLLSAGSLPDESAYRAMAEPVERMRTLIAQRQGLECSAMMATLETTSAVFIPWLQRSAIELGATDLEYTIIHGQADHEHAAQFAWALSHETALSLDGQTRMRASMALVVDFLKAVFVETNR